MPNEDHPIEIMGTCRACGFTVWPDSRYVLIDIDLYHANCAELGGLTDAH